MRTLLKLLFTIILAGLGLSSFGGIVSLPSEPKVPLPAKTYFKQHYAKRLAFERMYSSYVMSKMKPPSDTVHLIWMVGESNIPGLAPNTSASSGEIDASTNTYIWNNSTNAFQFLDIGVNNNINQNLPDQTTHGLELFINNAADAGTLTTPTYIVKSGWSGAQILEFRSGGSQYSSLYSRMAAARAYLDGAGIKYRITIWLSIGINDYNAGVSNSSYRSQLTSLKNELRAAVGNVRVIQTELLTGGGAHPYNTEMATVAAADAFGTHHIASTSGTSLIDCCHFSYSDYKTVIGPRMLAFMPPIGDEPTIGSFSFTAFDSTINFIRPGGGVDKWHFMNSVQKFIVPPSGEVEPMDLYVRSNFYWSQFETTLGNYNWTVIDDIIKGCIDKGNGQKLSFNIMTESPGSDGNNIGGYYARYPVYVHNQMQADGGTNVDQTRTVYGSNLWIPNFNNNYFLTRHRAFLDALSAHLSSTSYSGVLFKNVIGYIDIGTYGMYGEWHQAGAYNNIASDMSSGFRPTAASLNRIVDDYKAAFNDYRLLAIMHAFDGNTLPNTMVPPEVGYNVLTSSTSAGLIGWKRMNFGIGRSESYIPNTTINSSVVYGGMRFDTAIANRWRYAPLVVEGPNYDTRAGGPHALWSWPWETFAYHPERIANGNLSDVNQSGVPQDASQIALQAVKDSANKAFRKAGARLVPTGGSAPTTVYNGSPFSIAMQMSNIGVSPVYENWTIQYQLQNTSTSAVVWTGNSGFNIKSVLPGNTSWSENVTVTGVTAGTYKLVMKMVDPNGYRLPYPFGINGRQTDGAYVLLNTISVDGSTPPDPPAPSSLFPRERFRAAP